MKNLAILLITGLILSLWACSNGNSDDNAEFADISPEGWAYGDTIKFSNRDYNDSVASRIVIAVRHTSSYKYANLWLEMTIPTRDSIYIDTLNIRLSDRYGRPLGKGSGVSFIKTDTLPRQYILEKGEPIKVRHIMRVDTLRELEQLGVMLIK